MRFASQARMAETWSNIGSRLEAMQPDSENDTLNAAISAMQQLVDHIAEGPLSPVLFGWMSMDRLCVQMVDVQPFSGPYLKIAPQGDGTLEFCYHDTAVPQRQWKRRVEPEYAIARFMSALDQLRWTA